MTKVNLLPNPSRTSYSPCQLISRFKKPFSLCFPRIVHKYAHNYLFFYFLLSQEIEDQLKQTCSDIRAEYLRSEIDTPAMYDKMRLLRVYT